MQHTIPTDSAPTLKRSLGFWQATLYGLGVTIGAGIYVLIAPAVGVAGIYAPLAFIVAAVIMALTGASFAELASRMPVASGEAAYVRAGFRSETLATVIGLMVIAIAIVSAAAISVGSAGYIAVFVPLPQPVLVAIVVAAMAIVAMWGIVESVTLAATMTAIEIGGLLIIIAFGFATEPATVARLGEMIPPASGLFVAAPGILAATVLAVFAFIGFEALANVAEEVEAPTRNLPRAIMATLVVTTLLYVLVVWVSLIAVPQAELAAAKAPLALVFQRLTGGSPLMMSAIAVVATLNGIIVQLIMASRVAYGLARQGRLPRGLGSVHARTRTPVNATIAAALVTLILALTAPLAQLAEVTSLITLAMFAIVNVALGLIKARERTPPEGIFRVWTIVPWAGAASSAAFLVAALARHVT